jgi:dimethylaniline monooxygenase (N-oxide forming)
MTGTNTKRRAAVVGAGASGITAAKHLLEAGVDVTVYEQGSKIGGLWVYENDNDRAIAYRSLHINTEKRVTQFSDFSFAEDVQTFPSHEDMATYLEAYSDHFRVTPRIRFNTPVRSVEPDLESDRGQITWIVRTDETESRYDSVVLAPGHLADPLVPSVLDEFEGDIVHASDYRDPQPFGGLRVLVVGSGNSGCDIAADICTVTTRAVMVARSPELITPKILFGRPLTEIAGKFDRWWLPPGLPNLVKTAATRVVHGRMETWGFETPKGRTHPTSNPTIIGHIAFGRVAVKRGIQKIDGKLITFSDGATEEFDTIIAATGYDVKLEMISPGVVPVKDKHFPIYLFCASPEWPGLYFVGFSNASASSNLRMFEFQSKLVAMYESGQGILPSSEGIETKRTERANYLLKHYPPSPKYALELEPAHFERLVRTELKEAPQRFKRLDGSAKESALRNRSVGDRLGALNARARTHT